MENRYTRLLIVFFLSLLALTGTLMAQSRISGNPAAAAKQGVSANHTPSPAQIPMTHPAVVNFTALSNYEHIHPPKKVKRFIEQGEDREEHMKYPLKHVSSDAVNLHAPEARRSGGDKVQSVSASPTILTPGVVDNLTLIPADIGGAAGPMYVMETTNQQFNIYTKNGVLCKTLSIAGFFQGTGGSGFFDPHILYDPANGQFIVCIDGKLSNGDGAIFVAVSKSNDPTGNWYVSAFDGTGNSSDFLDFPELGYNTNWVVVTANDFPSAGGVIAKIYVLNRAALYSGAASSVSSFTDSTSYNITPAQTVDTTQTTMFMVQDLNGNADGNGYMNICTITGPVSSPVYSTGNSLGINMPWSEASVNAPQSGGNLIDDGDTRVGGNVTYVNGSLWFAHTVFLPADVPTHAAVDWWQINPVYPFAIQQFNRVEDQTGTAFYYYPSINVNANGDALLGYCTSSPTSFASAAYSYHASADPASSMEGTNIYEPGVANYYKTYGSGRNRWGDYTCTVVDFTDNSFWNFNAWANYNNYWATVIANVAATSAPACQVPAGLSVTNITSSAATFNWTAVAGALSYNVQYRVAGTSAWTTGSSSTATFNLTGLSAFTTYEWEVQTVCAGGNTYFSACNLFCTSGSTAPAVSVTQPTCSLTTGTITITSPTGTGLTYSIDGINYTNTSGTFTSVAPGTYTVTAKNGGGCVTTGASVTLNAVPVPQVTVVNNCNGTSTLSTSATGSLLWSTGKTTSSITVSSAGAYSVTSTVNGCTSPAGSGTAAPRATPATPTVTVTNNCGNSVLSTTAAGALLWNNGATTSSTTVTASGTFSVTQAVNGCTSLAGSGSASPKSLSATPSIKIGINCKSGIDTLSTTATGTLLWNTGATTSSITVSTAGNYSLTQITKGLTCTSLAASASVAPGTTPSTPVVTVANSCGTSLLSTTAAGTLHWSNSSTTSSITVTAAGVYTVTTTSPGGCTSSAASGTAAPVVALAPVVTVTNNCTNGTAVLSTSATGTRLWSTGSTSSSITVSSAGVYSVTQTVSGCISPAGSGTANPGITPATPVITVTNNCGNSLLSTTASGKLLWSNSATTSSITVTAAATYSVTNSNGGCVSTAGTATSAPKTTPAAPAIIVVNNCNSTSTLSTTATGARLWSNGATSSSIIVSAAGIYTATQTVSGCTSPAGSGTAAPASAPPTPVITVVNNCNSTSALSTTASGALKWSTLASTSSITVSTAASYTVTATVNGCASTASAAAAPGATPSTPTVTVTNSCGSSLLYTSVTGAKLWSTGATTSSITVTSSGTYSVTQKSGNCTSAAGTGSASPLALPATPVVTVINNCNSSVLSTTATGTRLWSNAATTSSITVTTAGTYTVTQKGTTCTSAAGSGIAAPTAIPATPASVTGNTTVCKNTGPFPYTVSATAFATSYIWTLPAGATADSLTTTGQTIHVTYGSNTASGSLTVKAVNSCGQSSAKSLTITLNAYSNTTSTTNTIACNSFSWNGTTYTQSGTATMHFTNAGGCDSAATLNLTISSPSTSGTNVSACGSYNWNGTNYNAPGSYIFHTTNAGGCDSAATLNLTINSGSTSGSNATACGSYTWNGTNYNASGSYIFHTTNAGGCDSAATLNLTINSGSTSNSNATACDSYTWNGTNYTTSGSYVYHTTNLLGCDSAATLLLTINYASASVLNVEACSSYPWNGTNYTASGSYIYAATNAAGCDSTATLNLTINERSTSSTSVTACDYYAWNGRTYTRSTTCIKHLINAAGCDSAATLHLTLNNSSTSGTSATACDSYTWNGSVYNTSGSYTYTTAGASGCDSAATLLLTLNNSSTSNTSATACDTYTWNGSVYNTSGSYTYTTAGASGCDSAATLLLTINNSSTSGTSATACDSYTWNGSVYNTSGSYTYTMAGASGCDSAATLNLTINNAGNAGSAASITACDSYIWNGTIYSSSGSYDYYTTNAGGCDSTATVNLTINYSTVSTTNISACDSLTWNDSTYTQSTTDVGYFTNAAGCDSAAILIVTINNCDARLASGSSALAENVNMSVTAYPNPANNKLTIELKSPDVSGYELKIIDRTGRLVLSRMNTAQKGSNLVDMDVSHFADGIYTISVTNAQGSRKLKVMVSH